MSDSLRVHLLLLLVICALASPAAAARGDLPAEGGDRVENAAGGAVTASQLAILNIDVPATITPGEQYTLAVQVENRGDVRVTRTIRYVFEGQRVLSTDLVLSPGEKDTAVFEVTLEMIETSVGDVSAGTHTHGFVTENGAKNIEQVTVETASESSSGTASSLRVTDPQLPDTIRPGEQFTLAATVVNTGDRSVTRTLAYTFAGDVVIVNEDVTIAPGESESIRFPQVTLEVLRRSADVPSIDPGTYTHAIGVEDGPKYSAQVRITGTSDDSTESSDGSADSTGDGTMAGGDGTASTAENTRPQRGFLTNGQSRFPILSNVMNLTVLGFLLSVAGIFHQLLTGR